MFCTSVLVIWDHTHTLTLELALNSWAGRRGYRAPPGNQFLIDVSRLEKYQRKRFAMLKSWKNFPHTIFMHISDAITEKCIFRHISANSAHSLTPCFEGPRALYNYSWSDQMCLIYVIAQNIAAIKEKSFLAIAQPILKITEHNKFPDLCSEGQIPE